MIYFACGPWLFGNIRKISSLNIGEDQKKVLPSESGTLDTAPYGKSGPWLLHDAHKKITRGPEIATFWTKTFNFIRVTHIN